VSDEDELEAKFQAMLQTPEGRAALEAEKQAILEEEAKKEAKKRRFDISEVHSNRQQYKGMNQANNHVAVDIGDVEGGWKSSQSSSQLNFRKKGDSKAGHVKFDLELPPEDTTVSKLEAFKARWLSFKGVCREASNKTKQWVTKTLQGADSPPLLIHATP
jgi:hypothetical protein